MSLRAIVAALGGDLYAGGHRASVPAPGHSPADRSISLLLDQGRVVIHGFGSADWRAARDQLRERGLIDRDGRLAGAGRAGPAPARPDGRVRVETARRLWAEVRPLNGVSPADRHLRARAVQGAAAAGNLGVHPRAPVSVYAAGGPERPALVARVSDAEDRLTAVELTYLDPGGRRAAALTVSRKTVGTVPRGAAVRLHPAAPEMLVAEGVVTTLSAIDRFQLPGWALRSAHNLAAWTPGPEVRRVLIAADRGPAGEAAAGRLRERLLARGLGVRVRTPPGPWDDWNALAVAYARRGREGGEGCRSGGDRPRRPAGDPP